MRSRNLLWGGLAAGALIFSGSCKEVAGPVPVESITVSQAALDLVPGETAQLTAVARDAAGESLSRPITWSSSAPAIATVDNGAVRAVAPGDAIITASAEGKSTTLAVTVEEGGLVGPAGGTISAIGGIVQLAVPAAAVVSASRLLIGPATSYPTSARLVRGTAFELRTNPTGGLSGQGFSQPALLTIRYDPANIGATPESGLNIYEVIGSGWQQLDQSSVNTSLHTVSTRVTGLGVYAVLVEPTVSSVAVSPDRPALRVRDNVAFTAVVRDLEGTVLSGRTIAWSSSDASILRIEATTGNATAVSPGSAVVTATCDGVSARADVTVTAGSPARIRIGDGDSQTAIAGATLPIAPAVVVTDADGFAVAGAQVSFSVSAGGGSITGSDAITDANGVARVGSWTLGTVAGSNSLAATLSGADGSPVVFTATAQPVAPLARPPATIAIFAGDGQVAPPGTAVSVPPAAKITDAAGNPVAEIPVTFSIRSGGGSITGAVAVSDANGIATVGSWTLGSAGGNSLFATLAGVSGSPLIFVATATTGTTPPPGPPPPPPATGPPVAIVIYAGDGQSAESGVAVPVRPAVKITDASGAPVPGFAVTFSIRSGGGSLDQPDATTDAFGIATVGAWTLGSPGGNSLFATAPGLTGSPVIFIANATLPAGSGVRTVTFGDSNTDFGWAGTNPTPVVSSYVSSSDPRMSPDAGNSPYQLAGKIEARWRAQSSRSITAVNHGVSATSTGIGRTPRGAPNARTEVGGVTRFAGEVLGVAYPWNGGEPTNSFYPSGAIARVRAFSPGANDFVYVSMGTNDPGASIGAIQTAANLEWMIDQWVNSGHSPDHFILTTLAPANGAGSAVPLMNTQIRALASRRAVRLVDIATRTSDDNGQTWRSAADNVDGVHYSEAVRDWIADQVVSYMLVIVPK